MWLEGDGGDVPLISRKERRVILVTVIIENIIQNRRVSLAARHSLGVSVSSTPCPFLSLTLFLPSISSSLVQNSQECLGESCQCARYRREPYWLATHYHDHGHSGLYVPSYCPTAGHMLAKTCFWYTQASLMYSP